MQISKARSLFGWYDLIQQIADAKNYYYTFQRKKSNKNYDSKHSKLHKYESF